MESAANTVETPRRDVSTVLAADQTASGGICAVFLPQMPTALIDRLRCLAVLHNALAIAHAEGRLGVLGQDLQKELGLKRKAVYNYAEELRKLGAPVSYVEADQVWRYDQTWNFPYPTIETLQGPVGARMALDFLLDPDLEKGLVGRIALDPDIRRSSASLPRMTGKFASDLLGKLVRSLKERRRVRFIYRRPDEAEPRVREVEPLGLFEWDGMPYLQARDPANAQIVFKRYALSRMERLEVLDATFKPPPRRQIPSCLGAFLKEPFDAVIQADPQHAPYVRERRWHPKQRSEERKDGTIRFVLPFGDYGEAARWILGRGPGFRPIAPPRLVEEWAEMVAELSGTSRQV